MTILEFSTTIPLNLRYFAKFGILHNSENVKNTHGGMILLVMLQLKPATLLITLFRGCFSCFLNCANGTRFRKASQISLSRKFLKAVEHQ